jgi:hypothetical protein
MTVFADKTDANNNTSNFTPGGVADVAAEELAVKREELAARRVEAQQKIAAANAPWWRGATPLSVAVAAGALTIMGNIAAALYTGHNSLRQEKAKATQRLLPRRKRTKLPSLSRLFRPATRQLPGAMSFSLLNLVFLKDNLKK